MNKGSFEDSLASKFFEDNPQCLDDDFPDMFEDWIADQDPDQLIKWANQWGNLCRKSICKG